MFFKGIAFNGKTVSFNRELKHAELLSLYQLLKDFFKNEPAYEALANFEESSLIKDFNLINEKTDLYQHEKIIKKIFRCFQNELSRYGYIQQKENAFTLLEKPVEYEG